MATARLTGVDLPKTFSVPMGGSIISEDDRKVIDEVKEREKAERDRVAEETCQQLLKVQTQKKTKRLIPYGTRLLVQKRKVDQTSQHIILPDEVAGMSTDIADVIAVPDQTFIDQRLIANSAVIIEALTLKATQGDAEAVNSLFKFKEYLQIMHFKAGDVVLLARYGGTDFLIPETNRYLCVADCNGIYCLVKEIPSDKNT